MATQHWPFDPLFPAFDASSPPPPTSARKHSAPHALAYMPPVQHQAMPLMGMGGMGMEEPYLAHEEAHWTQHFLAMQSGSASAAASASAHCPSVQAGYISHLPADEPALHLPIPSVILPPAEEQVGWEDMADQSAASTPPLPNSPEAHAGRALSAGAMHMGSSEAAASFNEAPASSAPAPAAVKPESQSEDASLAATRPRRRTSRYAVPSASSRAAGSNSPRSGPPALESANSSARSGSGSDASAQCSEQEEEAEAEADDDDYVDSSAPPARQAAKRKRTSTVVPSTAAALKAHTPSPPMKGLDKRERNKLSASQYRKRRKIYLDSLEAKVGEMDITLARQNDTITKLTAENRALKEQVSFLKKMMGALKAPAPAQPQQHMEQPQPANMHYGARRGMASSAAGFLFVVIACLLLLAPGFAPEPEGSVATGRRGRSLLSFEGEMPALEPVVEVDTQYAPLLSEIFDKPEALAEEAQLLHSVAEGCRAAHDGLSLDAKSALCAQATPSAAFDHNATDLLAAGAVPAPHTFVASVLRAEGDSVLAAN